MSLGWQNDCFIYALLVNRVLLSSYTYCINVHLFMTTDKMLLLLLFSSCLSVGLGELEEAVPGQFPHVVSLKVPHAPPPMSDL